METLELLRRLIGFNTSPGTSTVEIADFIGNLCEDAGFAVERYTYLTGQTEPKLQKVNLIARRGGQESFLALAGHMDTVAFDSKEWISDPLVLAERHNRLYGRGAVDMKGFLAIVLRVGQIIKKTALKNPVALVFTSDEEVGCLGVRKLKHELSEKGIPFARFAIIGEPTEMRPVNMHKGYMYLKIEMTNKQAGKGRGSRIIGRHSSDPRKFRSVVKYGLRRILDALYDQFELRLVEIRNEHFDPPYPTMNVVLREEGGTAKNIIPAHQLVEMDLRPIPGQNSEALLESLEVLIKSIPMEEDIGISVGFARRPTPPMYTSPDSLVARMVGDISGEQLRAVCFNTEGGVFNEMDAQTVIWGPGDIKQAHQINEFIDKRWFGDDITEQYMAVVRRMCC
ncbi:MAG: M20 family metallopeptidase [Parcubacteria group bacterium]|nr:M20 family metallopeptidase [Parcubacteria group bacterium]